MKKIVLMLMVGMSLIYTSCYKDEYMVPPQGEIVPYVDSVTSTMREVLAALPYSLFYQAWQRSSMDAYLEEQGSPRVKFTVLVPTNAAMEAAGWDGTAISAANAAVLDSLVLSHTFVGAISKETLENRMDNYPAVNTFERSGLWLFEGLDNFPILEVPYSPYRYRGYLALTDGRLWINGETIGTSDPISTADGYLWPVNSALEAPRQTFEEALDADPRFSLYMALMRHTDQVYRDIYEHANGYPPPAGDAQDRDFVQRYGLGLSNVYSTHYGFPMISRLNTLLIPTNEAFQQAGFTSLVDLMAYNTNRGLPQAVWMPNTNRYEVRGEFATDTLLDHHHNWGRRFAPGAADGTIGEPNITVFYSNDLRHDLLEGYPLNGYQFSQSLLRFYHMPLAFSVDGSGRPQIRVKGSTDISATVVVSDINTLNGPLHGLNRLLVPIQMQ